MADWIKVHRKLLDSDVFANPDTLKIWIWLLLKANYKDRTISLKTGKGYEDVLVKRGKVLFGRNKAEEFLHMSSSKIYRHIQKLESLGKVSVKSNNHYSIITICKYELYQSLKEDNEQPVVQPTTQPIVQPMTLPTTLPTNTPKKDNKEEEGKEFNKYPLPENFNGLPEIKIGAVQQLLKITKQTDATTDQIKGLWDVFKVQTLTGKKFYGDADDVYSHFINWSKTQKIENHGQQSNSGSDKSTGSASRKKIDALRNY